MVENHPEQTIAAPVEKVFDWRTDPANLAAAGFQGRLGEGLVGAGRGARGARGHNVVPGRKSRPAIGRSFPPFHHEGGTLTFMASGHGTRVYWLTN